MASYTVRDAAPANLGVASFFQPGATRTSNSPTLARYTNPSGTIIELQTVGATFGAGGVPTGGTVLAITLFGPDGTTEFAGFTDISVSLVTFDTGWLGPVPHNVFALLLSGPDELTGGAADDTLTGFTGDDTIEGGGGVNTASFPGIRADHVITDLGGGIITVTGPAGTDTLSDIQYARFTDGLFALAPNVAPVFSITPDAAAVFEGLNVSTTATFTIRNTGGTTKLSTVDWAVKASPIGADVNDFKGNVLPSGSVTFTPGETIRTITVAIGPDAALETDEVFTVELSQPVGDALFFNTSAKGTILNDDVQFAIAADKANRTEGSGDPAAVTPFTFTITRIGYADSPQVVKYSSLGSVVANTVPASQDDFEGSRLVAKVCGLFPPLFRGAGPLCRAFQNGMNPASMFTSPAMIDVLV